MDFWRLFTLATWLETMSAQQELFLHSSSQHLQYTGRVAMEDGEVRWQWQGVKVGFRVRCASSIGLFKAHVRTPIYPEKEKYAWLLDGLRVATFDSESGVVEHMLNLTGRNTLMGEHTLELMKISESVMIPMMWSLADGKNATVFDGFTIPTSCTPLDPPARPNRRLEFIGDSITCGFGNLAKNVGDKLKCGIPPGGWRDYEDFTFALPALASTLFGAEVHTECISNVGIMRNGDTLTKTTTSNMSHYIHGTLLTDHSIEWDYMSWVPHVAIINLGTNDYDLSQYVGLEPSFDEFQSHYLNFLSDYISHYRGLLQAVIIACGPMTSKQCPTVASTANKIALAFPSIAVKYLDVRVPRWQIGCINHPNVDGDHTMLDLLKPVLIELTGWIPREELLIV